MAETTDSAPLEVDRDELVAYLDTLLKAGEGKDFCPNGLQVQGAVRIQALVTGVSACHELFQRAGELGAQAVLVHHGLFWHGAPMVLTGIQYQRVRRLLDNDLSLLAYHLPLDRHPRLGNNALAAKELGLVEVEPFGELDDSEWGVCGRFADPSSIEALADSCTDLYEQAPLVFPHGPREIRTLGIVSGAAERALHQAIERRFDAFVTGESSEWVMNVAREAGIHFLAAGHYATERLGVRALGEHLQQHFGIRVEFVDIPNPI